MYKSVHAVVSFTQATGVISEGHTDTQRLANKPRWAAASNRAEPGH